MATDHRQLLLLLDDLMKPISTVTVSTPTKESEQILTINLIFSNACERFNEAHPLLSSSISVIADHPVYYRYLQIHLHILEILLYQETAQLSSAGDAHLPLFSIQDEAIIYRSLSFVVLLGLILHFDEGISLSLEKYFQNTPTSIHLSKLKCDLSHHDRMFFLNETLERLMHWIQKNPTTSSIVQRLSSHHLLELLLSHLQLLFSPNLKYSSKEYSKSHLQNNFDELKRQFSTGFIQQLILLNRFLATTINSPMWLRQKCGELFTSILIDPNHSGVLKIFQIILDSSSAPSHDRLYVSLAQILSACPKQLSPDVYLQSIKFQMLELFRQPKYRPIINIALDQLWKKYPKLIEKEIFAELFRVLFVVGNPPAAEIATADEWERLLNDLESLTEVPSNQAIRSYLLENHLSALINLHLALEKSLSADRERFFRIIVPLFSSIDVERALEYFQMILFRMKHTPLVFHPEQSSTICLTVDPEGDNDLEFFGQTICKILFQIEDQSRLIVRLFLQLLQSLITKGKEDSAMMMWTEKEKQKMIEQLLIMDVLKRILEYLTEHVNIVIDHLDDTIRVIQIVLNKLTESCQRKSTSIISESDDDFADDEILQIVLTIASLFITQYEQLSFENKQKLTSLYSSLKWIEEHHPSSEFRQLTHELSVAFLTFGAVKGVASARTETSTKKKILIEELDDSQRDLRAETFSNAWACLNDSSLPIRAHGLILFRRLIERADGETLKSIDDPQRKLFEKFQAHLQAEDSYEYLAAINVLSALTNRYTEKILPILCDEYVNQSQTSRKIEDLLKVGEILVKTTRQLGDLSSKYASRLINTFLYASKKTDDSLYRASALSNLGQLCTVLKYSLSKDLVEILVALKSYLSIFESAEVRRAAILVCELLCQSLEQSTWLTILGDQLTSFYQLIKHLYQSDRDDVVRLHAQLALEALNQICREFLQPSTKLEKQIRILS